MEALGEISQFLDTSARLDLKAIALNHVLGLTGSEDARNLLLGQPEILRRLVLLTRDPAAAVAKDACLCLINVSADDRGARELLALSERSSEKSNDGSSDDPVRVCLRFILDKDSPLADPCCMILSNMTRPASLVAEVIALVESAGFAWDALLTAFTAASYNTAGAKLHYLGPVLSNLSQNAQFRRYLTNRESRPIRRLLPFTEYKDSLVRRGGIIGTLKNCCFDTDNHEWLLGPRVDALPHLLLPLAGPEPLDDEDNDKLPLDLQYLPESKQRESDPHLRLMLLEALGQLCAIERTRRFLRDKNTYVILRELHKAEQDPAVLLACENVVDVLVRTEDEIGLDNIKEIEVPAEYAARFEKMDEELRARVYEEKAGNR